MMATKNSEKKLRIGFIHPDLGIGGAERLVVDAAVALQKRGHEVVIFTSRHDPARCFEETKNGTLQVHVLGSSLPRQLHRKLPATIIFSILRNLLLTFLLCMSLLLPLDQGLLNPLAEIQPFDVFFVDQQSVCIPFLRFILGTRVVFYCHFPDKLLSGGWEIHLDKKGDEEFVKMGVGVAKRLYRFPIDKLEEWTTGQADIVLANSGFTSRIYARAFPSLAGRHPKVMYPCIDVDAYKPISSKGKGKGKASSSDVDIITSDRRTFISLNRFEKKKNVALAIQAFAKLRNEEQPLSSGSESLRLVVGGGYDDSLPDNVQTLKDLKTLCDEHELSHITIIPADTSSTPSTQDSTDVIFILNFTSDQRSYLLTSSSIIALLYTPSNEHFGIVPIEAMACGLPIIAVNSGGPTESLIDLSSENNDGTGLLRNPDPEAWSIAMQSLLDMSFQDREKISENGKRRASDKFSLDTLGKELEDACLEVQGLPDLHDYLGDRLIWGGATLMLVGAVGTAVAVSIVGW